jgi:hypothetical protein
MSPVPGTLVKQLVGKVVHIALADGMVVVGQLVSFDGRSLWMVAGGEDVFIPLHTVFAALADPVGAPALT